MPNAPAKLKQSELTRYLKAVAAAGFEVGEVRIEPDGGVRIIPANVVTNDDDNPCDRLLDP